MPNGCRVQGGPKKWSGGMDDDGYRTYKVTFLVVGTYNDGPANAMQAFGLPVAGDEYVIMDDVDVWAFAKLTRSVTGLVDKEPNRHFDVEVEFSSKPDPLRCKEKQIDDPLLTPDRISGSGVNYTEEASYDRFGNTIENSAHEPIRGPKVEFDAHREEIKIGQNRAALELALFTPMQNTVNDRPLWGFPARCIKLKPVRWDQKFYAHCFAYYERNLEFEINVLVDATVPGGLVSGWDRDITDEGSKVLHGHWDKAGSTGHWILDNINGKPPNPNNPTHFDRSTDRLGNPCRAILDGHGKPVETAFGTGQFICVANAPAGTQVSDTDFWIPLVGDADGSAWDETANYVTGQVINYFDHDYVAIADSFDDPPPSGSWALLPGGLTDDGTWNAADAYTVGALVKDFSSDPGVNHIEKYTESNFLLLGIPLSIG